MTHAAVTTTTTVPAPTHAGAVQATRPTHEGASPLLRPDWAAVTDWLTADVVEPVTLQEADPEWSR